MLAEVARRHYRTSKATASGKSDSAALIQQAIAAGLCRGSLVSFSQAKIRVKPESALMESPSDVLLLLRRDQAVTDAAFGS